MGNIGISGKKNLIETLEGFLPSIEMNYTPEKIAMNSSIGIRNAISLINEIDNAEKELQALNDNASVNSNTVNQTERKAWQENHLDTPLSGNEGEGRRKEMADQIRKLSEEQTRLSQKVDVLDSQNTEMRTLLGESIRP